MTGLQNELKMIGKQTDSRLSAVEKNLACIDNNINSKVKAEVSALKSGVVHDIQKELKETLQDSVRKEIREIEDQKLRVLNLICFNLIESDSRDPEARKEHDIRKFCEMCDLLGVKNVDVKLCFRLGNKQNNTNRPLKIILNNKKQRKEIIDSAANIKSLQSSVFKRCIITKDLTPRQREANKQRREDKKKGETKVKDRAEVGVTQTASDESDYNDETVLDTTSTQSQPLLKMRGDVLFPNLHKSGDGRVSPFSDIDDTTIDMGSQLQDSILLNCSAIVQNVE